MDTRFEYYKDDEKTTKAYRGEYFTLGDMGYVDEDGYLFLTDRSADLIISGGVNIYPAEIDAVMLTHPAVRDSCTIGIPNEEWGEEVKGVIELKDGYEPSDELARELIEFARTKLAKFKCPKTIDFEDELPRHETGKLYRRLIRETLQRESEQLMGICEGRVVIVTGAGRGIGRGHALEFAQARREGRRERPRYGRT